MTNKYCIKECIEEIIYFDGFNIKKLEEFVGIDYRIDRLGSGQYYIRHKKHSTYDLYIASPCYIVKRELEGGIISIKKRHIQPDVFENDYQRLDHDGYHSFDELYEHRTVLYAYLCNSKQEKAWKSKVYSDGQSLSEGWFLAGIETPEGQITYHISEKYWDLFHVAELQKAVKFDGHTSADVINRIKSLLNLENDNNSLKAKIEFADKIQLRSSEVNAESTHTLEKYL